MSTELRVFEEGVDIWRAMEQRWREIAAAAVSERGTFRTALSGGRTPLGFYCHMSRRREMPWAETEVFQVDERFVPPGSDESNLRMLRRSLLSGGRVKPAGLHGIPTDGASADEAARRYEEDLRESFGREAAWPVFDLVLLGIGRDGHTASLFPGGPELEERQRWVVASSSPAGARERITLTLPVLNSARNVFFLATGAQKRPVLQRVRGGERGRDLPCSLVRPGIGKLAIFVDRAAGSGL